jgi:carbamoyltransferase
MLILGINMFHPDASAAIVQDGKVLFAIAEERLNRKKHYAGVPLLAVKACLLAAGVRLSDVDHVAIGRDVHANRAEKIKYALSYPRQLPTYFKLARRGTRFEDVKTLLARTMEEDPARLRFREHHVEHHIAHIASSFYCSGWDAAAGLSYDGSGDFVTTMLADCRGTEIKVLSKSFVPDSLGAFYTMICEFIGYRQYGDEGKVMGLAPYGSGRLYAEVRKIVRETETGFELDRDYFLPFASQVTVEDDQVSRRRRFGDRMLERFGPPREPRNELGERERDLAFAMQRRFEEVAFHLMRLLHRQVPLDRLVLAGGVALNSVANGKLFDATPFRETWIQPACGDDGLAVGAALYVYHSVLGKPREHRMTTAALGPQYSESEIRQALDAANVCYERPAPDVYLGLVAQRIAAGDVVGWFQGRMEWGPRALGNRSILCHPGHPEMKEILNSRIKNREWFRPFAPSILAERQSEYFEHDHPSPFMLHVFKIRPEKRKELCAVNHVDDTGRLQSVDRESNPRYYDLIREFEKRTGTPVILNTSFNENEPIVCRPEEAIDCYQRTKMDVLAIGPFLARKVGQVSVDVQTAVAAGPY